MSWNTLTSTSITDMDDDTEPFTAVSNKKKKDKKLKSAMKSISQPASAHPGPPVAAAMMQDPNSMMSQLSQLSSLGKAARKSTTFANLPASTLNTSVPPSPSAVS
jgi:hypothetical protein